MKQHVPFFPHTAAARILTAKNKRTDFAVDDATGRFILTS
jgi:hypothetical protein